MNDLAHDQELNDYDQWFDERAMECTCAPVWGVCGGVLAGGMCDQLGTDDDPYVDDWYEE